MTMPADLLLYLLLGLNIFQAVFWGYQCHVLVNKLMSRNFAEYDLVTKGPKKVVRPESDPEMDAENDMVLKELNAQFSA